MQASMRSAPFAILFCAALYLFSLTLGFDFPHVPGRVGPDIWPQAILLLLMLACAIGIIKAFLQRENEPRGPEAVASPPRALLPAELPAEEQDVPSRYGLVVLGMGLFLLYPVALEYVGFLTATFLLMVLFMIVGQWRRPVGVLAISLIGTIALFYVFRGIVYVSLPLGTGPFLELSVWAARLLGMQ